MKTVWKYPFEFPIVLLSEAGRAVVHVVLLNGWVKDKKHGREEPRRIETAQDLLAEYRNEGGE